MPEPYLPTQRTFLDAIFDPLSENTPEEQEEMKEVADKKMQLGRLSCLLQDGHITQSIFDYRKNEILGLDILIKSYVSGTISKSTFEKQKMK